MKRKRGETIETKKFDNREKRKEKEKKKKEKLEKARNRAEFSKRKCTGNGIVAYSESSSSSSSEDDEPEEEESEPEEVKTDVKILNQRLAKVNDNMKAQPEYETVYNGKLLRSHWTNIQKNGKRVRYPVGSYKSNYSFEARTLQPDREMPNLARPNLLEMLLKNEIRKERNELLQALHYIVERDFFNKS